MRIRQAVLEDGPTLMPFARQTFSDTYVGHPKSTADPVARLAYMDETFTPAYYAKELSEAGTLFFICEEDEGDQPVVPSLNPAVTTRTAEEQERLEANVCCESTNSKGEVEDKVEANKGATKARILGYAKVVVGGIDESLQLGTNPKTGLPQKPIRLQRLYVGKQFIGQKGVGKALLHHCFEVAKENKCDLMWLGTWGENTPAIDFYIKHGFHISGELYFQQGYQRRVNTLMQREL